jgi:hypothetical protein
MDGGSSAFVLVDGAPYFSDCLLRTKPYLCSDGRGFVLEILHLDESEAITVDGTNGKRFTLVKQPAGQGANYGDGTILVEIDGPLASVQVEGMPYFIDCVLKQWQAPARRRRISFRRPLESDQGRRTWQNWSGKGELDPMKVVDESRMKSLPESALSLSVAGPLAE